MRTDAIKPSVHFFNALLQAGRGASLHNKHAKGEAKGVFQKLLHEASDFGISCRQKRCFQNMHPYTLSISGQGPQRRVVLGSGDGDISLIYSSHKVFDAF